MLVFLFRHQVYTLHFTHTLEVSHLSDDVFDTGERKAWVSKTHLPTAQVWPQQLQHQTNIYIVVKNQLSMCIAVLYKRLKLYKSIPQAFHRTDLEMVFI